MQMKAIPRGELARLIMLSRGQMGSQYVRGNFEREISGLSAGQKEMLCRHIANPDAERVIRASMPKTEGIMR